jgi:imidazoleglycerol-phosphate dehydratase
MTLVTRTTRETSVRVELERGGNGSISTTVPFLDHMLLTLERYSGITINVSASGDLRHHIVEDTAICFGAAMKVFAPARCARYADRAIPMDDALVHCAIDLGGRAFYAGRLPSNLYDHWMRSFSDNAAATVHLRVLRGHDRHHIVEAAFKSLGLCLRDALRVETEVFSTKGTASVEISV